MAMATKMIGYGGTLAVCAIFYALAIGPIVDNGTAVVNNTTLQEAQTGAEYTSQAAAWSPFFILMILLIGMIAVAVFRSENP